MTQCSPKLLRLISCDRAVLRNPRFGVTCQDTIPAVLRSLMLLQSLGQDRESVRPHGLERGRQTLLIHVRACFRRAPPTKLAQGELCRDWQCSINRSRVFMRRGFDSGTLPP